MKIILLDAWQGRTVALSVNSWAKALLSLCVLGLPLGLGAAIGLSSGDESDGLVAELEVLEAQLNSQKDLLAEGRTQAVHQLAAYSSRLAEMQARVVRLDALGERITDIAGLDSGEFDFAKPPAVGGPSENESDSAGPQDIESFYAELDAQLEDRERQLGLLKIMMVDREFKRESTVAGLPVKKGWMSSAYGMRRDPFHGKKTWHKGIDIAGKDGTSVIAVAGGIVTRSETKSGYGELVEIDHGNTLVARYAHNKQNLVKVGDLVKKGQVIALMGSTGRSTGPHVHFEVYKNGRHVDPASYIRRTIR
ncbi:MAG: M23 family metallopeptidase [Porticoccaceae bacterium]|nr:M23 family metallopeptidase [Porticoccaceae bacterium]